MSRHSDGLDFGGPFCALISGARCCNSQEPLFHQNFQEFIYLGKKKYDLLICVFVFPHKFWKMFSNQADVV